MKRIFRYLLFSCLCLGLCSCSENEPAAASLAERLVPEISDKIVFVEKESESGKDFFELISSDGRLVITGNNGVAQASGLNYYLEHYCGCQLSVNGHPLALPDTLPVVAEKIRKESPYRYRYLFNYCTYGYTMPWWDWDRWEEMIDYMAMKGVNMPLSIIGQEAVWYEVYKELGLSEEEIASFFVGPAHLPWGWMGNIDGLGGPLPEGWFTKRVELQKKILERERELGMTPVLQAFTGHVPKQLATYFPDAKITQIDDWAGVEGTMFLDPTDSLFNRIGTLFIQKQTEMFGTDHIYDADCFIEVNPPSSDPEFLKNVSETVYESMHKADPDAIWLVQGWFLYFRSDFWQEAQSRAFFSGVPEGKMIVLDLYGEKYPVWDKSQGFYGQDWIWNVICNNDQKVNMSGDLDQMQSELERAKASEYAAGLKGIGIIPEGIGYNDPVYDFIFSRIWSQDPVRLDQWIGDWAERRYGTEDEVIREAWKYLYESVYARTRIEWSSLMSTPQLYEMAEDTTGFDMDLDVPKLAQAASCLLGLSGKLGENEAYQFDLVNVFRELLHSFSKRFINDFSVAFRNKDIDAFQKASDVLVKLLDDMDKITSTHPRFMLGPWLEAAKSWADDGAEMRYFDNNARTIITIWQPYPEGSLRDYASRQWGGLLKDFHIPRWKLLSAYLLDALQSGKEFDAGGYDQAVRQLDYDWTKQTNCYGTTPTGNPVEEAKRIWEEYKTYFEE